MISPIRRLAALRDLAMLNLALAALLAAASLVNGVLLYAHLAAAPNL